MTLCRCTKQLSKRHWVSPSLWQGMPPSYLAKPPSHQARTLGIVGYGEAQHGFSKQRENTEFYNSTYLMSSASKHTRMPKFTRRGRRRGMTRISCGRTKHRDNKLFSLTRGFDFSWEIEIEIVKATHSGTSVPVWCGGAPI